MKIRIFAVILICATLLSLAACSSGNKALYYRYDYDLEDYVDVCEYKGISIDVYEYKVTDEDIASQILLCRSQFSKRTLVTDRAADTYDIVKMDYYGYVDGELLEGGSGKNYELVLGSDSFIDGFEDGLLGATPGETVTLELNFPTPYPNDPKLSGKAVTFVVTVNSIYAQELPEFNDAFVKNNYGYNTTKDFVDLIRTTLENKQAEALLSYKLSQTWEYVCENSEVIKFPKDEYDALFQDNIDYHEYYASEEDMSLEEYVTSELEYASMDAYYNDIKLTTEDWMKQEMIFYYIARKEKITINDQEYNAGALEYAKYYGLSSVEAIEQYYAPENIRESLLFDKIMEFIADKAVSN